MELVFLVSLGIYVDTLHGQPISVQHSPPQSKRLMKRAARYEVGGAGKPSGDADTYGDTKGGKHFKAG